MNREEYFIIQSFFSPTIYNIAKDTELADVVCYHPLDFIWSVLYFFVVIKPNYFVITRHDIWPNHLIFAKLFKCKTFLINANLHKKSFRLLFGFRNINKWLFMKFDLILTGSKQLKNNLLRLVSEEKIIVSGDSRFDSVADRLLSDSSVLLPGEIKNSQNIILGSIIPSDYEVIFNGFKLFFSEGDETLKKNNMRIIIVPHEIRPYQLKKIEKKLIEIGMKFQYYSEIKDIITENVIIVDAVGILADLYKYGDVAYVGAGFGAGVHSVIEPAIYKCIVSFGPNISILDEAISMFNLKIGFMVKNSNDFAQFLQILNSPKEIAKLKYNISNFIEKNINKSMQIISLIFD